MQPSVFLIWIGALFILGGVLFMAAQAIWHGRFKRQTRTFDASGFGMTSNWPGFALVALGAVLLLAWAAV